MIYRKNCQNQSLRIKKGAIKAPFKLKLDDSTTRHVSQSLYLRV